MNSCECANQQNETLKLAVLTFWLFSRIQNKIFVVGMPFKRVDRLKRGPPGFGIDWLCSILAFGSIHFSESKQQTCKSIEDFWCTTLGQHWFLSLQFVVQMRFSARITGILLWFVRRPRVKFNRFVVLSHQIPIFVHSSYCRTSSERNGCLNVERNERANQMRIPFVFYFINVADGDLIRDKIKKTKNFLLNFMFIRRRRWRCVYVRSQSNTITYTQMPILWWQQSIFILR